MRCPECGCEDAYMGFSKIDCPTQGCRHYNGTPFSSNPAPAVAAPAPAVSASSPVASGPLTAVATQVSVTILSIKPKLKTVEIEFMADGDPGNATYSVEFQWSIPGTSAKSICTLSSPYQYYCAGIDPNGATLYKTNWKCLNDGIQPTDQFDLDARIF